LPWAWFGAAAVLLGAILAGVLLAQVLMSPPAADLWSLAAYLTVSGIATMGVGWMVLRGAERLIGLSIQTRAFVGGLIAATVALLNVLIVAQAMFISTSHDLKLLVAIVVFSAVITGFFSLLVARSVSRRLQPIRESIGSLASGDLGTRISVSGEDELSALASDINTLARKLQAADEQRTALDRERRELTAAISHDLRTPLASLRAMVEALDDGVVDDAEGVSRYYGTMKREIDRLSRMIEDLFELAQIDAGALRLNRASVDIREIAADVADAMQVQAKRSEILITLKCGDKVAPLSVDGARIERALANLVRNAIEHTPRGGQVDVLVAQRNGLVELSVSDDGPGIAPEDLPHVWDRFYRGEKSRRRADENADGAGLGLAIVRGIVEAHGGAAAVESSTERGATFTMRLPAT
jgi:signal transduction histidine kinase